MSNRNWLIILFAVMVLAQLAVPFKMIFDREKVLTEGKTFKFKTAPIDPSDPFRGKYVTLRFKESSFRANRKLPYKGGENTFVILGTDEKGFAKIIDVAENEPNENIDFVKAKVTWYAYEADLYNEKGDSIVETISLESLLTIEYPFERFYMEESKAPLAESMYWEAARDTTKITYASVNIQNGQAVLKDVFIGDVSIRELVKAKQP